MPEHDKLQRQLPKQAMSSASRPIKRAAAWRPWTCSVPGALPWLGSEKFSHLMRKRPGSNKSSAHPSPLASGRSKEDFGRPSQRCGDDDVSTRLSRGVGASLSLKATSPLAQDLFCQLKSLACFLGTQLQSQLRALLDYNWSSRNSVALHHFTAVHGCKLVIYERALIIMHQSRRELVPASFCGSSGYAQRLQGDPDRPKRPGKFFPTASARPAAPSQEAEE